MEVVARKIGGSLYFRIPVTSVQAHDIRDKDYWEITLGKLIKRDPQEGKKK